MTWYEYIVSRNIYEMANFLAALAMTGKLEKLKRDYEVNTNNATNYSALIAEDIEAFLAKPVNFEEDE